MNKQDVIEFLLEKPGYLKEGAKRLSDKLGVDAEVCYEALKEARVMVREEDEAIDNLVLKSRWQTASGEWRESYTAPKQAVDNSEFLKLKNELLADLENLAEPRELQENVFEGDEVAVEINLPDFHFGKKDGLTIQEQATLYVEAVGELVRRASVYNISRFFLPMGNDILNSEGMRQTTTRGTPQEDNAGWRESFRMAWLSVVSAIKLLSEIAPVTVITVLGNHDFERCFYLGELLSATFSQDDMVQVINNGEERNYVVYGNNLLAYTHGDKIKPQELPLIMATEVPVEFSKTTHRSWRLGHIHKHMKDEYRGIEVEFLPSLGGSDEWHRSAGYYTDRKAMAYIWDTNGGKIGFVQINK